MGLSLQSLLGPPPHKNKSSQTSPAVISTRDTARHPSPRTPASRGSCRSSSAGSSQVLLHQDDHTTAWRGQWGTKLHECSCHVANSQNWFRKDQILLILCRDINVVFINLIFIISAEHCGTNSRQKYTKHITFILFAAMQKQNLQTQIN